MSGEVPHNRAGVDGIVFKTMGCKGRKDRKDRKGRKDRKDRKVRK